MNRIVTIITKIVENTTKSLTLKRELYIIKPRKE